jgi:hypothetical protein
MLFSHRSSGPIYALTSAFTEHSGKGAAAP